MCKIARAHYDPVPIRCIEKLSGYRLNVFISVPKGVNGRERIDASDCEAYEIDRVSAGHRPQHVVDFRDRYWLAALKSSYGIVELALLIHVSDA